MRRWLTHVEAAEHLGVHPTTLRARMAASPPHIRQPWVELGSRRAPRYRWLAAEIEETTVVLEQDAQEQVP